MKLLKFVFIVLFVAVNIAMGQGYGLEFRIELEKDVFFEGEEIIITTYLENRGNEEVEVENFTLGTAYEGVMTFILSNSEGDTVKLPLVFLTDLRSILERVSPGETIVCFTNGELNSMFDYPFSELPVGDYTLVARFDSYIVKNGRRERIILTSNAVHFKIIPPEGKEKEAYDFYFKYLLGNFDIRREGSKGLSRRGELVDKKNMTKYIIYNKLYISILRQRKLYLCHWVKRIRIILTKTISLGDLLHFLFEHLPTILNFPLPSANLASYPLRYLLDIKHLHCVKAYHLQSSITLSPLSPYSNKACTTIS